jgi:hypothetical protein
LIFKRLDGCISPYVFLLDMADPVIMYKAPYRIGTWENTDLTIDGDVRYTTERAM